MSVMAFAVPPIPTAIILLVAGLLACFLGYRLFRWMLVIYGFAGGAFLTSLVVGEMEPWIATLIIVGGGVAGALLLRLVYLAVLALLGAGLGAMAISLVMMSFYAGIGVVLLASFSLLGLLDPVLLLYLLIFFLLGFFVLGSLMLAGGAAVNDMNEAASLQAPLVMVIMVPWLFWPAVARSPDSVLAHVVSFLPPINTFGMVIRMASTQPPPWWQVWLSIAIGVASVVGASGSRRRCFGSDC